MSLSAITGNLQGRADFKTRFVPGRSGNPTGRPKGSRNKFSEEFFAHLYADWKLHGRAVIARVRTQRPHEYLKLMVSLLPKRDPPPRNPFEDMSDDELEAAVAILRRMIAAERIRH